MPRGAQPKIAERESRMIYTAIKLFLENGYENTTTTAIAKAAGMTTSTFFAVFPNKESLLLSLTKWMYEKQFAITDKALRERYGDDYARVMFYVLEPAIQLAIAERSEGLRELYVSSFSYKITLDFIYDVVTDKLVELFGDSMPAHSRRDFYEIEIANAGITRNYMAQPCTPDFTLEQKLRRYLTFGMTLYHIDPEEQQRIIDEVLGFDLKSLAEEVVAEAVSEAEEQYQAAVRRGQAQERARRRD